ncbi:lysine--tRNA ligase [Candidatus Gottesmanbacteria bacterium]|nr:lysine--tRNA ligase [Candidatus Gottesmanbacteria bacterium]
MAIIDALKKVRLEKLEKLKQLGVDPYPAVVQRKNSIKAARDMEESDVAVAGRIMGLRGHGKIVFADLADETEKIQVVLKADGLTPEALALLEYLDIGDFLAVQGMIGKTQSGELSVFASNIQLLSKAIRPLPNGWYGLKDVEERYRKRYLDLLMNPQVKKTFDARWKIEQGIRSFLWGEGYVEVETPVLQSLYGGTNAKPFTTHVNTLDSEFYLRLAPELYLKRLIVGGYERVFEIARNFRNEGFDLSHQPEFTMLEFYEAYADYHRIMELTEELFKHLAQAVNGSYQLKIKEHDVDISGKWQLMTIDDALLQYEGIVWDEVSDVELKKRLAKTNVKIAGQWNRNKALFAIYDHFITPKLIEPTWVIDYPRDVSPLSRQHRDKEGRVERFEGYIGGEEICDGWTEIVSAIEQRARFEQEQKNLKAGDAEAHPLDEDFLTALEYGCPPLGGIGIGIDRLTMLLTNTWSIKEVIPFPLMKREV